MGTDTGTRGPGWERKGPNPSFGPLVDPRVSVHDQRSQIEERHEHQLQRTDPQQRRPRVEQDAAARARALAAALPRLVEGDGTGRVGGARRLSAHRDQRRAAGLGALRLRPHARLPLGHLPRAARDGPQDQLRRAQGRAGLAGSPGRVPLDPAPHHRDPGRHRAGLGRAAAPPRPHLPVALRPAQPVPGQRRGRPPPLGDGLSAARATSAATAARKPRRCSSAAPATPTTRAS